MSRAGFTPGPWTVERGAAGYWNIKAKCGPIDVQPATAHGIWDAHLIAAAPDLHETLRTLLALHIAHHNTPEHVAARAALARARGEQP